MLIWPYFGEAHRPLTLSPGCSHVSSALRFDGLPLRKPPAPRICDLSDTRCREVS